MQFRRELLAFSFFHSLPIAGLVLCPSNCMHMHISVALKWFLVSLKFSLGQLPTTYMHSAWPAPRTEHPLAVCSSCAFCLGLMKRQEEQVFVTHIYCLYKLVVPPALCCILLASTEKLAAACLPDNGLNFCTPDFYIVAPQKAKTHTWCQVFLFFSFLFSYIFFFCNTHLIPNPATIVLIARLSDALAVGSEVRFAATWALDLDKAAVCNI